MGLVQIVLIWGVASAALFPSASPAGEWEDFKELKSAMVRSSAKRDFPLPVWASSLEYFRAPSWYDVPAQKPYLAPASKKENDNPLSVAPAPVPVVAD